MEGAYAFFRRWFRLEPAAFFYFSAISLTAFRYLTRFGSPRMGFVSCRTTHPRMFTAEPVRRLSIDSAELVHAPPYIRVGREDGFCGRAASVTSPPASCGHLSFQARQGLGYGVVTFLPHDSTTAKQGQSSTATPLLPHGSPERRAVTAVTERSP